jgi:hypothetical protein
MMNNRTARRATDHPLEVIAELDPAIQPAKKQCAGHGPSKRVFDTMGTDDVD